VTEIRKIGVILPISAEFLRMLDGTGDDRSGHFEPPSTEDVAAFEAWKAAFEPLYREGYDRGWFHDGGPDYGFEYQPPSDKWVFDDEERDR
jgi:hypothetical protein